MPTGYVAPRLVHRTDATQRLMQKVLDLAVLAPTQAAALGVLVDFALDDLAKKRRPDDTIAVPARALLQRV